MAFGNRGEAGFVEQLVDQSCRVGRVVIDGPASAVACRARLVSAESVQSVDKRLPRRLILGGPAGALGKRPGLIDQVAIDSTSVIGVALVQQVVGVARGVHGENVEDDCESSAGTQSPWQRAS